MELNVTLPKEHDNRTPPMGAKLPNFRWLQLSIGIVCMVMIANLQYGWTLFVNPLDQKFHWARPAIQVAFTIFIVMQTWLVPFEGYVIDRLGPRVFVCAGGVLVGIAWALNSVADSLMLSTGRSKLTATSRRRAASPTRSGDIFEDRWNGSSW